MPAGRPSSLFDGVCLSTRLHALYSSLREHESRLGITLPTGPLTPLVRRPWPPTETLTTTTLTQKNVLTYSACTLRTTMLAGKPTRRRLGSCPTGSSVLGSVLLAIPLTYASMPAMVAIARGSVLAVDFVSSFTLSRRPRCYGCDLLLLQHLQRYVARLMQHDASWWTPMFEPNSTDLNGWIVDRGGPSTALVYVGPCV